MHVHVCSGNLDPGYCPSTLLKYRKHDRSAISAANSAKSLSASAKVRGACLKMSVKKAEMGKRAAECGVLATIRY